MASKIKELYGIMQQEICVIFCLFSQCNFTTFLDTISNLESHFF